MALLLRAAEGHLPLTLGTKILFDSFTCSYKIIISRFILPWHDDPGMEEALTNSAFLLLPLT